MAFREPRYLVALVVLVLLTWLPTFLARRRMRRLLMSGDVERVIGLWQATLDRITYPETMVPLMSATAFAAYGWIDAARSALGRAVKGPAWDAAMEQRLFVEALLDTFEGDRRTAIEKARALECMPMPVSGLFARKRVALLRMGVLALARAFAHESLASDQTLLMRAASASPLVHWAMRYAAAVAAIDAGRLREARDLIGGAPEWPQESAFRAYHRELLARAEE
jgi:hypothetical protein